MFDKSDDQKKRKNSNKNRITPLQVWVDDPSSKESLERAMRKLSRLIKKEGVFKEFMWRRHHHKKNEKKPKYFD